jgi:hypothetical protein
MACPQLFRADEGYTNTAIDRDAAPAGASSPKQGSPIRGRPTLLLANGSKR